MHKQPNHLTKQNNKYPTTWLKNKKCTNQATDKNVRIGKKCTKLIRSTCQKYTKHVKTNKTSELKVDGLFIAIGHDPATALFKDQLKMDKEGYLITKPDSTITNIPGVFAAGDVKDKIFRQAVTAAGMGCMAALEAEKHLSSK